MPMADWPNGVKMSCRVICETTLKLCKVKSPLHNYTKLVFRLGLSVVNRVASHKLPKGLGKLLYNDTSECWASSGYGPLTLTEFQ